MRRTLLALLLLCPLCAQAAPPKRPKLVLAIVIDQFRYDYLTRFRVDYNSGLARLLEHGAVFTDAQHIAVPTVTAIGHATLLTGSTPSVDGIAGNEWFDRESKRSVTSVSDAATELVGGASGLAGSSPRRLLVSTLGDELKMHGSEHKVIGISIKDRSAILPAGHMADAAYWFDPDSNHWVSSTYYLKQLPRWVVDLNAERPVKRTIGASWTPLEGTSDRAKPFCTMISGTDAPFCSSLEATPWGNEIIEEMAERAVVGEKLGRHTGADLLAVSFSSNDYVGHAVGPDAPEVRDISIRTDRLLGKLLDFIDQQVGAGETLLVLTADHGVAPVPEVNQARRMPGGRLPPGIVGRTIEATLSEKYGQGKWLQSGNGSAVYLNLELMDSKHLSKSEVEETAAAAVRAVPHIFRVYTGEEILKGIAVQDSITRLVSNGYYSQRSADIITIAEPYYLEGASGTTHGTPFNYDTHVPVIFLGPGIKAGSYNNRIAVNDIAPTLATLLGVQFPSGSVGRVLSEIIE